MGIIFNRKDPYEELEKDLERLEAQRQAASEQASAEREAARRLAETQKNLAQKEIEGQKLTEEELLSSGMEDVETDYSSARASDVPQNDEDLMKKNLAKFGY